MELTEADIQLIEQYWKHALSVEETEALETRMSVDPSYKIAVTELQKIFSGVESQGEIELQKKLTSWSKEADQKEINLQKIVNEKSTAQEQNQLVTERKTTTQEQKTRQIQLSKWVPAIAATALLALAVLFLMPKQNTGSKLYSEYYEPYPDLISKRGDNDQTQLKKALNLYTQGKYAEAKPILEIESSKVNSDNRLKIYLGIACSQTGDHVCAQTSFANVILKNTGNLEYVSLWHKGLDLLKAEKYEEAKSVFHVITLDDSNPYNKKAISLLQNKLFK